MTMQAARGGCSVCRSGSPFSTQSSLLLLLGVVALVVVPTAAVLQHGSSDSGDQASSQAVMTVQEYYAETKRVFRERDVQGMARLFDRDITEPMTHQEIVDWAHKFFQNEDITFHILSMTLEDRDETSVRLVLSYQVTTRDGAGNFGGVERDWLVVDPESGTLVNKKWIKLS